MFSGLVEMLELEAAHGVNRPPDQKLAFTDSEILHPLVNLLQVGKEPLEPLFQALGDCVRNLLVFLPEVADIRNAANVERVLELAHQAAGILIVVNTSNLPQLPEQL